MATPQYMTPVLGVMKISIQVDPTLVITMHLVSVNYAWDQRRRFFKEYTPIFHFLPQKYLLLGWGVMKFTISCLLTLKMIHTKCCRYGNTVYYLWANSLIIAVTHVLRFCHKFVNPFSKQTSGAFNCTYFILKRIGFNRENRNLLFVIVYIKYLQSGVYSMIEKYI